MSATTENLQSPVTKNPTLAADRVRFMLRHHRALTADQRRTIGVFDFLGGELRSRKERGSVMPCGLVRRS